MKRPKRPRDPNQLAKLIVDISTGERANDSPKNAGPSNRRKGGRARAKKLTPEQRTEIARLAASARWKKSR